MTTGKYEASGVQAEFEPGSHNRVLRNLLGITRAEDMDVIESDALAIVQGAASARYGLTHRFGASDIRELHRAWLGQIYAWAGEYRTVDIGRADFNLLMRLASRFSWRNSRAKCCSVLRRVLTAIPTG